LDSVTADDVNAFLDLNTEEGPRLEYKVADRSGGIPDSAIETIVAFANTFGGLLILGVGVDRATNRPSSSGREGLRLNSRAPFDETLTSRCYASIQPALVPEIRVCPFKSDPSLPVDDVAFVIVRVPQSVAAPHAGNENQVYVRVGSQSRFADLPTLRFLFERERDRIGVLTTWSAGVLQHARALWAHVAAKGNAAQLARDSQRVYLELLPIDAPNELLPFGEMIAGIGSLDKHLVMVAGGAGWVTVDNGRIPMPNGLGIATVFAGNSTITNEERDSRPVTLMYFDRSGAMVAEMPTLSLGTTDPRPNTPGFDTLLFSQKLLYRIATLVEIASKLLTTRNYFGRIQISTWVEIGAGPEQSRREGGDHGETLMSLLDPWDEYKMKLAAMLSRMTRSWIHYEFTVHEWGKSMEPDLLLF
jgi:hypothetical protein